MGNVSKAVIGSILMLVWMSAAGIAEAVDPPQAGDPIEAIRHHYQTINDNARLYRQVKKELSGFSAEGGELTAYFHGPTLMKMVATFFGESGRAAEEYYYWNGKLIFVLRSDERYSKPLSGKIVETKADRFYFSDDKLIKWLAEGGREVSSGATDYKEKQNEYLKTSRQFSDGARSAKATIAAQP